MDLMLCQDVKHIQITSPRWMHLSLYFLFIFIKMKKWGVPEVGAGQGRLGRGILGENKRKKRKENISTNKEGYRSWGKGTKKSRA
jgi:hypothetical protein